MGIFQEMKLKIANEKVAEAQRAEQQAAQRRQLARYVCEQFQSDISGLHIDGVGAEVNEDVVIIKKDTGGVLLIICGDGREFAVQEGISRSNRQSLKTGELKSALTEEEMTRCVIVWLEKD